jgi:hypothetical protein
MRVNCDSASEFLSITGNFILVGKLYIYFCLTLWNKWYKHNYQQAK